MNEEKNIITLTDNNGNSINYELLDIIELDGKIYVVFYPTVPNDTEVAIFRVEDCEDVEKSVYIVEKDDTILKKVFKLFKEKYINDFKFDI